MHAHMMLLGVCYFGSGDGWWKGRLLEQKGFGLMESLLCKLQHALPRRRSIIFTNMGLMEVIFNRPVDVLQKILDNKMSHSLLEDFFHPWKER